MATRRWMSRSGPLVSASSARVGLCPGDVGVDRRNETGLAKLAEYHASEPRVEQRCGTNRQERFAPCLAEALLGGEGDPLRQHRERAARLLVLRERLPLALEDRERGRMERVARLESAAQELPCLRLRRSGIDCRPFGWQLSPPLETPIGEAVATFFLTRSLPRFSNSRRLTTSLISVSSLAIRSLATRRTTFVILSCHCRSQSVISTWLRGRLMRAAPWVVPVVATVRFWMNA